MSDLSQRLKRKRALKACQCCRQRKLRCSGVAPCGQCFAADRTCNFTDQTSTAMSDYDRPVATNGQRSSGNLSRELRSATSGVVCAQFNGLDVTASGAHSMMMASATESMHTAPMSSQIFANPVNIVESLGSIGDSGSLHNIMIYGPDQSESHTDETLNAQDDAVNFTDDAIPSFENDSSLADTVDLSDFWPINFAVSKES